MRPEATITIGRIVARFNRRVWNPLVRGAATHIPPFAVLIHRGRVSGRTYRTPVAAFASGDRYLVALVFGPDSDWVKNVLAHGGADLVRRGRTVALTDPELRPASPAPAEVPAPIRVGLRLLGTRTYLVLQQQHRRAGTSSK
jgi:deazaflavin-dependent oxidoreductase (nitroreductase family)